MDIKFPSAKEILAQKKAAAKAAKEAERAAADEQKRRANDPAPFAVLESSPEPQSVQPAEPSVKKRKAAEPGKKKILSNRSKRSKIASPDSGVGPRAEPEVAAVQAPRVESRAGTSAEPAASVDGSGPMVVDLPQNLNFLRDREAGVELMHQLLTEATQDATNTGRLQGHFDEFLWDSLKASVRAMGMFYRTTERVAEKQTEVRELKAKNMLLGDKLGAIEAKFRDVKANAEAVVSELQGVLQSAKDNVEVSQAIVGRFNVVQAEREALRAENEALKARNEALETGRAAIEAERDALAADKAYLVDKVVGIHEEATLAARYELLKEYKQGLLVEADVDEEIELFEGNQGIEPPVPALQQGPLQQVASSAEPFAQNDEPPASSSPRGGPSS